VNPVVIGGGAAGLAAACRLAGDGHQPLLIERSPHLGGRAASFHDPGVGEVVDFGHHVLMRCCTATTGFLRRIGMEDAISFQPFLSIPIVHGMQRTFLRSRSLPGPLHLAPSLLGYSPVSARQRRAALRAGVSLLCSQGRTLENDVFDAWLTLHRQDREVIDRLWNPICIATLNAPAHDVSTAAARKVFADGFFRPHGADLGFFTVPLSDIAAAGADYIGARDGIVRTGVGAQRIVVQSGAVRGVVLADGSEVEASAVVCAVTPWDLAAILPAGSGVELVIERALQLPWSPIVNVHLWFDDPVLDDPFFVAVDAPVQVVFDVSRLHGGTGSSGELTHVVVSQSAAGEWMTHPDDGIVEIVRNALATLAPATVAAGLVQSRVLRWPRATFILAPGSTRHRPGSGTPVRGLLLAGDWTDTGWPSTLEGAVRSGIVAAARAESAGA